MANKNNIKEKYTTGKGELTGFITLLKPSTKYDNYQANILLSKEEGEELTKKLKDLRKQQWEIEGKKGKLAELPIEPYSIQDKETGESSPDPQGRYIFKTSNKAHNTKGEPMPKPLVYNAKGQPITGSLSIGEGTIARLSVLLSGYKAPIGVGITAKLKSCQIINLVEYSGGFSFDDFEVEDGFDGVGEEVTETKEAAATDDEVEEEDF